MDCQADWRCDLSILDSKCLITQLAPQHQGHSDADYNCPYQVAY